MIGRIEKRMLIGIAAVIVAMLALMAYQSSVGETQARAYNVSVLVASPGERFQKGLEQAALDCNADFNLVPIIESARQQEELLRRELSNDTDVVILQAEAPDQMLTLLQELKTRTPIVTVGQAIEGDNIIHVGVDEAAFGLTLGELVAERAPDGPCLILSSINARPNIEIRADSLHEALVARGFRTERLRCAPEEIAASLKDRAPSTIVAVEEDMLVPLCEQAREEDALFGGGFASGVRPYLESGRMRALLVYSEFDAGYLSLQAAVSAINNKQQTQYALGLYAADASNMYTAPLDMILFPIG